jgi:hypothetical protein
VNPGVGLGMSAQHPLLKEILKWYSSQHFVSRCGKIITPTIVEIVSEILKDKPFTRMETGIIFIDNVYIYPSEYFSPKNFANDKVTLTDNTRSIHHFASTWSNRNDDLCKKISRRLMGIRTYFNI